MADYTKYTKQEMQAYAIAKNIKADRYRWYRSSVNRCIPGKTCCLPELPSDRREWSYGLFSDRGSAFCR